MINEIERRLRRMATNALLEDLMDVEDGLGEEMTLDEYIKAMNIDFVYDEIVSGLSGSRIDAILTVKSRGEEIYYFRMNIAG